MAIGYGHQSWIGFAEEVTYGTPVASTKFLEILKENIKHESGRVMKPSLRGYDTPRSVPKKKGVSGSFDVQMSATGLDILLKHAFGTVNTTGAGDPYTHAYTGGALPVGLTIGVNRDAAGVGGSSQFQYHGCQIDKFTLKQDMEDFLIASFDVVGEDSGLIAIETPSISTFDGFDWNMLAVTVNSVAVACKSFEFTVNNNLAKDRFKLGSLLRKGLGRGGQREITGKMTLEFESLTELNYFRNQTASMAISAVWTHTAVNRLLTIAVPKPEWDGGDPETGGPGPYELTLDWHALRSSTDGDAATVTLVNGTA